MCMILWQILEVCMEWVGDHSSGLRFEGWVHFIVVPVKLYPSFKLGQYMAGYPVCSGISEIEGINSKPLSLSSLPSSLLLNLIFIYAKFTTDISYITSLIYLYFNL